MIYFSSFSHMEPRSHTDPNKDQQSKHDVGPEVSSDPKATTQVGLCFAASETIDGFFVTPAALPAKQWRLTPSRPVHKQHANEHSPINKTRVARAHRKA